MRYEYGHFRTVRQARKAYRRCRTVKDFILDDDSPELARVKCESCGRTLADDPTTNPGYRGNCCEYHPDERRVVAYHYMCAWGVTMAAVEKLTDKYLGR